VTGDLDVSTENRTMFTPDSDFFDSTGDSSYHQDPFAFSPSLAPHRHRKQPGARRGEFLRL